MRLLLLKHFRFDRETAITDWAAAKGHTFALLYPPDDETYPEHDSYELLVILGGPMSVYEEKLYPWLTEEKQFVREALQRGKLVLGICFGAQMLAELLGSRVYRNAYKEIGWHKIERTTAEHPLLSQLPQQFYSFQWHGDCFDLPEGAVRLAGSEACTNQAFAYGNRVAGLQFHLEAHPEAIGEMLSCWSSELVEAPYIQPAAHITAELARSEQSFAMLARVLDQLAAVGQTDQESRRAEQSAGQAEQQSGVPHEAQAAPGA
ncbi:type 1 glutamine amidotransferase [Paenibacillus sp. SYP-B4298]|uniref:type 1 glutamine amidotransferase n=1 Tax=Paenibacillus sp. SYP-B4298 TaxID=2996034 RepID=UPI0022DE1CE7|nr:type 1 glutamine amidotransferase [Paenibacillus sp. SYP-B4298]